MCLSTMGLIWGGLIEYGMRHGTHVAGIAIGKKFGEKDPHGIAYNGKYYGLGKNNPGYTYTGNLYEDIKNLGCQNYQQ